MPWLLRDKPSKSATKPQTRNNHHSTTTQVDPYYAHGYSILGTMLRGQKDKTDAINAYQMSIMLVPGSSYSSSSSASSSSSTLSSRWFQVMANRA